jgi:competence ComEA-like helix-hairpin-helix protein
MLYSRPELRLLLVLAGLFLAGLAVREWRAGFPDAASRVERFDQDAPAPSPEAAAGQGLAIRDAGPSAGTDDARARVDPPPVAADPRPLDLNHATLGELARLPGVGPGLAQRILEERQRRGRFDSPEALRRVVGLGPKKLAALRDLVTVGE